MIATEYDFQIHLSASTLFWSYCTCDLNLSCRLSRDWLDQYDFLTGKLSTRPERAGIMGAILGTFWLMLVVAPVTMFLGVGTALYLELYAKKGRLQGFIQTNIANLAGVPSIVYGILGLTVFVRAMHFGNIVLAGGLTMALLIFRLSLSLARKPFARYPIHLSEASYGMGATKWQTIKTTILPVALPGILTGAILSLSRAIGETAPLVVIGIPALLLPFPEAFSINSQYFRCKSIIGHSIPHCCGICQPSSSDDYRPASRFVHSKLDSYRYTK